MPIDQQGNVLQHLAQGAHRVWLRWESVLDSHRHCGVAPSLVGLGSLFSARLTGDPTDVCAAQLGEKTDCACGGAPRLGRVLAADCESITIYIHIYAYIYTYTASSFVNVLFSWKLNGCIEYIDCRLHCCKS